MKKLSIFLYINILFFVLNGLKGSFSELEERLKIAVESSDQGLVSKILAQADAKRLDKLFLADMLLIAGKNFNYQIVDSLTKVGACFDSACWSKVKCWSNENNFFVEAARKGDFNFVKSFLPALGIDRSADNTRGEYNSYFIYNTGNLVRDKANYAAAESGDLKIVDFLLANGAHLYTSGYLNKELWTLSVAVKNRHAKVVQRLLQEKINVDHRPSDTGYYDSPSYRPLFHAIVNGDLEIVDMLINAGASLNHESGDGVYTPLTLAAECGHVKIVKRILQENIDVNADYKPWEKNTPLKRAIRNGHIDVVKVLLQNKKINVTEDDKMHAMFSPDSKILKLIESFLQKKS